MASPATTKIKVWDPFVRFVHWTVTVAFVVAYLTGDEAQMVHVWAGYLIGILVILRILWGFVGTRYARFDDFIYRPATVLDYLRDLLLDCAKRYIGHSPAGGAMVIALLVFLVTTVGSGLVLYAEVERAGPLAMFFTQERLAIAPQAQDKIAIANEGELEGQVRKEANGWHLAKVIHELFATLTLALVLLHISGVLLASFVHRENLPLAMITGAKRRE